ncbi:MAG: hypothetical protein PVG89_02945 [Gammaproteobacteria bacterium]|jgi:hypothetical protein
MTILFYGKVLRDAIKSHIWIWLFTAAGTTVLYYVFLLLITMVRFGEIPNYIEVYDIVAVYLQVLDGTPALSDAIPIMMDEAWIETGYKNPDYYGVATWSYMLIPPKMMLVGLLGVLVATMVVLLLYGRENACPVRNKKQMFALAGVGTGLVGLTSATLTWVVCCATPSWIVALSMLGMSSALALWLEPFGKVISVLGIGLLVWIVVRQIRNIAQSRFENKTVSG